MKRKAGWWIVILVFLLEASSCGHSRLTMVSCGHKVVKNRNNIEWRKERAKSYGKYYPHTKKHKGR